MIPTWKLTYNFLYYIFLHSCKDHSLLELLTKVQIAEGLGSLMSDGVQRPKGIDIEEWPSAEFDKCL